MKAYRIIRWLFSRRRANARKSEFDHIMEFAKTLAQSNPSALVDLCRILLRPLQSELMLTAIQSALHEAREEVLSAKFFMPYGPAGIQSAFDYPRLDERNFLVHLNRDPVLPCPWHRDRYVGTLTHIGLERSGNAWKEDARNHSITVWLPWGIAFVTGGNHSIATGIVGGEGCVHPREVYDMSNLLNLVSCDGKHFRSKQDGRLLDSARDYKIAALFEVGRLMLHHRVTPMLVASTRQQGTDEPSTIQ